VKQVQHPPGHAGDGVTLQKHDKDACVAGQLSKHQNSWHIQQSQYRWIQGRDFDYGCAVST